VLPAVASTIVDPGLDLAAPFRLFDHRQADAVFDGAAGIERLELEIELARPDIEALQTQHRRAADHLDHIGIDAHRDPRAAVRLK